MYFRRSRVGRKDLPGEGRLEHDGRRIEDVDGGWLVLNHDKWRAKMNMDERREYLRVKQQEHRARVNKSVNIRKQKSTPSTHTYSDAYTDTKNNTARPTIADAIAYGSEVGMAKEQVESWFDHFESNGWKVGGKAPMKDWKAAIRTAKRRQSNGAHQRANAESSRNIGTANEGKSSQYAGYGKIR